MKKMLRLFTALAVVVLLCTMPVANAFAENPNDIANTYQVARSGAQGSGMATFNGSGTIYVNMRETNRSVNVSVQVVSLNAEDHEKSYYVAWTTPSGKRYIISDVLGNCETFYFNHHIAEEGTHAFYFLRWDGNTAPFSAAVYIRNA